MSLWCVMEGGPGARSRRRRRRKAWGACGPGRRPTRPGGPMPHASRPCRTCPSQRLILIRVNPNLTLIRVRARPVRVGLSCSLGARAPKRGPSFAGATGSSAGLGSWETRRSGFPGDPETGFPSPANKLSRRSGNLLSCRSFRVSRRSGPSAPELSRRRGPSQSRGPRPDVREDSDAPSCDDSSTLIKQPCIWDSGCLTRPPPPSPPPPLSENTSFCLSLSTPSSKPSRTRPHGRREQRQRYKKPPSGVHMKPPNRSPGLSTSLALHT